MGLSDGTISFFFTQREEREAIRTQREERGFCFCWRIGRVF